ncbi:exonuclease SbcCD subunit D [Bacillus haynesii]|uniref:metallophosphoesterase family protein n=1 Tax=Bacillus haynesii TaxID=1925021 RepID=UPI00227F48D3|nr:exonuclease SbcCD subunit D [Bacillus haynesii]MCY8005983.1 exonuclease SbcCD subunit D [Bacillus haynesii]MCY9446213.1 exonuclease SbcCD subunit D [Bacillus haynesii]
MKRSRRLTNITFIHAADLHLDSPFHGISRLPEEVYRRIKNSTFKSAENVFKLAIDEQADFILLAGDLFDEANRSLKAQMFLRKQFLKLKENNIQVYVIFGNHDHLGGDWTPIEWPDNVHIFSAEDIEEKSFYKDGRLAASIYGYSYPERSVFANKAAEIKKTTDAPLHIGMIHGTLSGESGHDPYCPFSLQDLKNGQMDYWALGHIHKRQVISAADPAVIYPGNTQSRHMKETGEKGCYLVNVCSGELSFEFKAVSDVLWETACIDISGTKQMTELISLMQDAFQSFRNRGKPACVKMVLTGETPSYLAEGQAGITDEILDIFHEEEREEDAFIWLTAIEDQTDAALSGIERDAFFQELLQEMHEFQDFSLILDDLERHPVFRRNGERFNEEDFRGIRAQAEKLLLHELKTLKR